MCARLHLWYVVRVRRVVVIFVVAALASACAKRPRVSAPTGTVAASNESVRSSSRGTSEFEGDASYYADPYHGRPTANGETFDKNKTTAAHRTLPFDTWVRVENRLNGKKVDVRINDRGPFVAGRVIDLSLGAARKIDMVRAGVVPVRLEIIKEAPKAARSAARPQSVFYVVQVGAFREERAARALRRRIEKKYTGVYVDKPGGGDNLYKVWIGRALLREARRLQTLLKEDNIESIVIQMK